MSSLLSLGTTIIDGHEAEVRMWESSVDGGQDEEQQRQHGQQEQQDQQQKDNGEEEQKGTEQQDPKDQATLLKKFYAKADRTMSAGIRVDLVTTMPTAKRCRSCRRRVSVVAAMLSCYCKHGTARHAIAHPRLSSLVPPSSLSRFNLDSLPMSLVDILDVCQKDKKLSKYRRRVFDLIDNQSTKRSTTRFKEIFTPSELSLFCFCLSQNLVLRKGEGELFCFISFRFVSFRSVPFRFVSTCSSISLSLSFSLSLSLSLSFSLLIPILPHSLSLPPPSNVPPRPKARRQQH